jgi:hypothetical protein
MHQAVATVAEDNAKLSAESNSMYLNNQKVYEALCLHSDTKMISCNAQRETLLCWDSKKPGFNLSVTPVQNGKKPNSSLEN